MLNTSSSMLPNTRAWQTTNRQTDRQANKQTNKQESIEKPNEVQFLTDYRWTICISLCENGEVSRCTVFNGETWDVKRVSRLNLALCWLNIPCALVSFKVFSMESTSLSKLHFNDSWYTCIYAYMWGRLKRNSTFILFAV